MEFNDLDALERALAARDVACVLAEPALTNIGIVHPEPGFHEGLRDLTRATGTLLVIDETHTICCGPGGFTAAHGLEPDMLTIGKPIAGGVPAAAYGFTGALAERIEASIELEDVDVGGVGGTLAANALSLAAMRATLAEVLTDAAFARMIPLAERWTAGVEAGIAASGLPWHVTRLGCRAEYLFGPDRPRNGTEAHAAGDFALERYMHLHALNRGILLTPFHNMALMSPATTEEDVDRHTEVFREAVLEPCLRRRKTAFADDRRNSPRATTANTLALDRGDAVAVRLGSPSAPAVRRGLPAVRCSRGCLAPAVYRCPRPAPRAAAEDRARGHAVAAFGRGRRARPPLAVRGRSAAPELDASTNPRTGDFGSGGPRVDPIRGRVPRREGDAVEGTASKRLGTVTVVLGRSRFAAIGGTGLAGSLVKPVKAQYGQYGPGQYVNPGKVTLCHKQKVTIRVSTRALPAHEAHGDTSGRARPPPRRRRLPRPRRLPQAKARQGRRKGREGRRRRPRKKADKALRRQGGREGRQGRREGTGGREGRAGG